MELFWYLIIAVVLAIFFILDGYNFGTGIIHLFFAKTEKDKELKEKGKATIDRLKIAKTMGLQ